MQARKTSNPAAQRLMLFNRSEFELFQAAGGVITHSIRGKLTYPGSADPIQKHFQSGKSALVLALEQICKGLQVEIVEPDIDQPAFLGKGGNGYAFCVRKKRDSKSQPNARILTCSDQPTSA